MPYNYFFNSPPKFWNDTDHLNDQIDTFNRKISASMKISTQDLSMLTALSKLSHESRNSILNNIIHAGIEDVIDDLRETKNLPFTRKLRDLAYTEYKVLAEKHFEENEKAMIENHILRDLDQIIEALEDSKL